MYCARPGHPTRKSRFVIRRGVESTVNASPFLCRPRMSLRWRFPCYIVNASILLLCIGLAPALGQGNDSYIDAYSTPSCQGPYYQNTAVRLLFHIWCCFFTTIFIRIVAQVRYGRPANTVWVTVVGIISPPSASELTGPIGWTDIQVQATVESDARVSLQPSFFVNDSEAIKPTVYVEVRALTVPALPAALTCARLIRISFT